MKKKILSILLALTMLAGCAGLSACGSKGTADAGDGTLEITFAYQYGMAYAPVAIMISKNLFDNNYQGDLDVHINWAQMNSGAAINEAMVGGSVQFGAMGVAPFISGISIGMPYKMFGSFSAQRQGIAVNDPSLKSLKDFSSENKIALVNIGSIQHILLAMAAEKELGDAHALDGNIVAMAHPDGKTALENNVVAAHLTSAPYIYQEEANSDLTILDDLDEVWPADNSFIVGIASAAIAEEHPDVYEAFCTALREAVEFLNTNKDEAAEILCEEEGVTKEQMLEWLNDPRCIYSTEAKGIMSTAEFMYNNGFIESLPKEFSDFAFDNVTGN